MTIQIVPSAFTREAWPRRFSLSLLRGSDDGLGI